ncbi:hypothetical protein A6U98_28810 [Rhizobium sp. WYCCWR10014]|nr:hypothetical protein A6U98_28810 [Rhizobium sp. WYCCWR10014]
MKGGEKDGLHGMGRPFEALPLILIPVLVAGIKCAQVLGRERLFPLGIGSLTARTRRGWITAGVHERLSTNS